MSTIEDRLLVWRFNRGDLAGMCRIYEKHHVCLARVATALLNDRSLVEDVVHDVFLSFAKTAGRFKLTGSLKAFLSICVANRVRDINRSPRQRDTVCIGQVDLPSQQTDPEQETLRQELAARIDCALAELPDEQRDAVVLHLIAELPFRQIAELKEISVNTAMSRYRYGLEKLRDSMNGARHA
jgi:RNA polymerase sigma-70 factor (ECF subfamily)